MRAVARPSFSRWIAAGVAIDPNTPDIRLALKREIWTRGRSIKEISEATGMSLDYLERVLSKHGNAKGKNARIHPPLLNRLIAEIKITPKVARRLHYLGALEAGWVVNYVET